MIPAVSFAATGTMPWDGPIENIMNDLTGPVAQGVTVIIIVATGLMIAFGEAGAAGRKMLQIVFGIACALGAVDVVKSVFGKSTGALFSYLHSVMNTIC